MQHRLETSFIFGRLIFETIVSIRFLIKNFSPELIDSYVKNSFKHEARLRNTITKNIAERNGEVLPIEDRMMKSIDRSFKNAGIELSDVSGQNERNWGGKNIFEKAQDVGLEESYLGAFAGPSHSVHGAWHDVYSHNLNTEGDLQFQPNIEWGHPRPQLLFACAQLTIPVLDEYFGFMVGGDLQEDIRKRLVDLSSRIVAIVEAHEAYLSTKVWPRI